MRPLSISTGTGHSPAAEPATLGWAALRELLATPAMVEDKAAAGWWAPAVFAGNHRRIANVQQVCCAVLDFDTAGPAQVSAWLSQALPSTEALIVSSWSHMADGVTGKCRLVLPLARDVDAATHARVWDWLSRILPGSDLACSDPSRMWHMPAVTRDSAALFDARHHTGAWLDPDRAPQLPAKQPPSTDDLAREFGQPGNRHRDFLRLAGRLRASGLDYTLAEGIVRDLCQRIGADEGHHLQSLAYVYDQPEDELRRTAAMAFESPPADLLTRAWPPHPAVIDGLLPRGCVTLLASQDGIGKSRLVLLMAAHIAAGSAFAGRAVEPGRVDYVAAEDGATEVWRRLAAVYRTCPALARGSAGVRVAAPRHGALRIVVSVSGAGLIVAPDIDALVQSCAGAALIVLDTLSRVHGQNENDNAVGAAIISAGERLAGETGAAVLLVHHVGKSGRGDAGQGASRGASSLEANSRSVLRLLRAIRADLPGSTEDDKDGEEIIEGMYRLVQPKYSYGPASKPIWLRDAASGSLTLADM